MAGIAMASACFLACSGGEIEDVQVTTSALVVNQANVFGFEDPAQWTSTVAVSSSTTHTQGAVSLAVAATNYVEVTSAALPSLTGVTAMIGMDIRLPSPHRIPYWYGFVQLLVVGPEQRGQQPVHRPGGADGQAAQPVLPGRLQPAAKVWSPRCKRAATRTSGRRSSSTFPTTRRGTTCSTTCTSSRARSVRRISSRRTSCSAGRSAATTPRPTPSSPSSRAARRHFGQNALRAVTDAPFDFFLRYNAPTPIHIGTDDYLRVVSARSTHRPSDGKSTRPSSSSRMRRARA